MQMAPQVLHRVLYSTITPSAKQIEGLTIRPALLEGYTRHRVVDCDYPAIVPDSQPGACVRGTFVQGLKAQDLWRLDIFEGDQYERVFVKCRILQNETGGDGSDIATDEMVEAQTYEWIEGMHSLESREWDFDEFRTEKIKRWIGMEQFAGELRPSIRGMSFLFTLGYCKGGEGGGGRSSRANKNRKQRSTRLSKRPIEIRRPAGGWMARSLGN